MNTEKPRTEKQKAASRANGRRSRGPITPQGKANSALARALLLDTESRDQFQALLDDLNKALKPESEIDHLFIGKMAAAHWRQIRVWKSERDGDLDRNDREMRLDRQFFRTYDRYVRRHAAAGKTFSDTSIPTTL